MTFGSFTFRARSRNLYFDIANDNTTVTGACSKYLPDVASTKRIHIIGDAYCCVCQAVSHLEIYQQREGVGLVSRRAFIFLRGILFVSAPFRAYIRVSRTLFVVVGESHISLREESA